jgi:hypothetical protein
VTLCARIATYQDAQEISPTPRTFFVLHAYPSSPSVDKTGLALAFDVVVFADTLHVPDSAVDVADEVVDVAREASRAGE